MNIFTEAEEEQPLAGGHNLNEGQQEAYDKIIPFINGKDKEHYMYVLKGYAGTGKTYTLTSIVEEMMRQHSAGLGDYRITMSAPTHKAVRVMRKFSNFKPGSVHYSTVHSLLGLRAVVNERTGKEEFKESSDPSDVSISQFNVLILDETSMLPDEIFVLLLKHVRRGLKILFCGDPIQIPPVNHLDSIPFKADSVEKYKLGVSELTHIMRQAGDNPILRLATMVRMGYKTVPHFLIEDDYRENDSHEMIGIKKIDRYDDETTLEAIKDYFCTPEFKDDPDHMKIIAWRNKTVDAFNALVRERIYPLDELNAVLPYIMKEEKLIIDKPVLMPDTNKILLSTNEEIEVLDYEMRSTNIVYTTAEKRGGQYQLVEKTLPVQYYMTRVTYFDLYNRKVTSQIRILHENNHKEFEMITQTIADIANEITYGNPVKKSLWKSFFAMKKIFAQVKYNYALTIHKS